MVQEKPACTGHRHTCVVAETGTTPPRAAYVGTDTGTLASRKSLPQPGSQAHSAPGLFSEGHSQPQREQNPSVWELLKALSQL